MATTRYRTAAQEWADEYHELHAIPGQRGPVRLSQQGARILQMLAPRPRPLGGAGAGFATDVDIRGATLSWTSEADSFVVGHAHGASSTGFPRGDANRILTAFRALRGRGRSRAVRFETRRGVDDGSIDDSRSTGLYHSYGAAERQALDWSGDGAQYSVVSARWGDGSMRYAVMRADRARRLVKRDSSHQIEYTGPKWLSATEMDRGDFRRRRSGRMTRLGPVLHIGGR